MSKWSSTITNDPDDDFRLIIEIEHEGEHVATIKKIDGEPHLDMYEDVDIPEDFLAALLQQAKEEIE